MTSLPSNSEPYDEFYASVKLVSGEEVLCVVMIDEPKSQPDKIIIDNPVLCKEAVSYTHLTLPTKRIV